MGSNNSSGNRLRGVRQRHWGSWVSEIRHPISKRRVWLGTFPTREEAVRAYDTAAWMLCGPKAKTNYAHSALSLTAACFSAATIFSPALRRKLQRCSLESAAATATNRTTNTTTTTTKRAAATAAINPSNRSNVVTSSPSSSSSSLSSSSSSLSSSSPSSFTSSSSLYHHHHHHHHPFPPKPFPINAVSRHVPLTLLHDHRHHGDDDDHHDDHHDDHDDHHDGHDGHDYVHDDHIITPGPVLPVLPTTTGLLSINDPSNEDSVFHSTSCTMDTIGDGHGHAAHPYAPHQLPLIINNPSILPANFDHRPHNITNCIFSPPAILSSSNLSPLDYYYPVTASASSSSPNHHHHHQQQQQQQQSYTDHYDVMDQLLQLQQRINHDQELQQYCHHPALSLDDQNTIAHANANDNVSDETMNYSPDLQQQLYCNDYPTNLTINYNYNYNNINTDQLHEDDYLHSIILDDFLY